MRTLGRAMLWGMTVVLACVVARVARPQEPPAAPQAPATAESSSDKSKNKTYSHANDFLIIGTVFNDKGYAFPGAQLRIRRSNEKKFRWDGVSNSRGEFAVRVPQGTDYEMVVHAKGFADQSRTLDAKAGLSEARIVFRMEPGKEEKK